MNYSETKLVFPPKNPNHAARVIIFTPRDEMPFAGHPNVGTCYLLASPPDLIPGRIDGDPLVFEEIAGLLLIHPNRDKAGIVKTKSIAARQSTTIGHHIPTELVTAAINLDLRAIKTTRTKPIFANTGVFFSPLLK